MEDISHLVNKTKAAIIPHAGKQYAGKARKSAFDLLNKSTKYIIYIVTIHQINTSIKSVYVLHETPQFKLPEEIPQENISYNEHSFAWVERELKEHFEDAYILAIGPNKYTTQLKNWIVTFMNSNDCNDCKLIASTDLIHYGKNFLLSSLFIP